MNIDSLPVLKVFLSYSHSDKIVARRIVRTLTAHRIKIWFDDRELRIGTQLTSSIRSHIENVDALLVLASQGSADSIWVGMELDFAMECGKTIIPIFVEPLSTHQRFKDYLGLEAILPQSFADAIDKLMRDLYQSIDLEVPSADQEISTQNLRELSKEEPNISPLILGCLDGEGFSIENTDTVFNVSFHMLDYAINSLFILHQSEERATIAAYGFIYAGVGTKTLFSWTKKIGDGGIPLSVALGSTTLNPSLLPTAISLLTTCDPPNNRALYGFIEKNYAKLDDTQRRSVVRLVVWPIRSDIDRSADVLGWVAFKHFSTSIEIQRMWVRWIKSGVFDKETMSLARYLSDAHKEQLPGWEPIKEAIQYHIRVYLRSRDEGKFRIALRYIEAFADYGAPLLHLLLNESSHVRGTAEWDDWRKNDPETAELMRWLLHYIEKEASGERDWLRARQKAYQMVNFEKNLRKDGE